MSPARPRVGVLCNPTTPMLLEHAPSLIEHIAVMPDRMWYDFGSEAGPDRFSPLHDTIRQTKGYRPGRSFAGHGLGLSLPSAMPLDRQMLSAVADMGRTFGGFDWYSEHLNVFITPRGGVPNAQAGLGLPVTYDAETFAIVAAKLHFVTEALGCRVLMENGSFFTPVEDLDMTETEFLNRLYRNGHCGTLLDLHNLLVNERNGGPPMEDYLDALDPSAVEEVHLAGGDDDEGFYMDSHSTFTPERVWDMAEAYLPRCRNLRAITFEYQESYFADLGLPGLVAELERMHRLADRCATVTEAADAG